MAWVTQFLKHKNFGNTFNTQQNSMTMTILQSKIFHVSGGCGAVNKRKIILVKYTQRILHNKDLLPSFFLIDFVSFNFIEGIIKSQHLLVVV